MPYNSSPHPVKKKFLTKTISSFDQHLFVKYQTFIILQELDCKIGNYVHHS